MGSLQTFLSTFIQEPENPRRLPAPGEGARQQREPPLPGLEDEDIPQCHLGGSWPLALSIRHVVRRICSGGRQRGHDQAVQPLLQDGARGPVRRQDHPQPRGPQHPPPGGQALEVPGGSSGTDQKVHRMR